MKKPARLTIKALCLTGLALLVAWLLPSEQLLVVTRLSDQNPILEAPLKGEMGFTLYYHHSVNGMPIWEVHSVDKEGRIFIEEERFVSFNAGMGHWQGHGTHVNKDGFQSLVGIHKPTGDFVLRVGSPKVGHTVIVGPKRTNLSLLAPGQAVQFSIRPMSFLEKTWRKFLPNSETFAPGAANDRSSRNLKS
ncbi:DUF1850 domain-containing protein [Dethiosulfatarculus sandiegensis]|uniref:DUF1850 domain-containing protein n=1 Tax=Dethiosulfatarculus sandiegensis TaxID=1429043 RepID=A0A0D2K3A8_9BACT|nr:DUF1850 domain-containing protein [Dethiosulfatarculus sandiegensis]KIX16025.1 hypothetical protein X474_00285 [Dethiosulfatarculus sandiegensis]